MTYQLSISALADPKRRKIVELLRSGPQNVAQLAGHMPISRPAVSQHLKILSDAGLLAVTPSGTRRIYRLEPTGADDLRAYLDRLWGDALSAFKIHIEKEATSD